MFVSISLLFTENDDSHEQAKPAKEIGIGALLCGNTVLFIAIILCGKQYDGHTKDAAKYDCRIVRLYVGANLVGIGTTTTLPSTRSNSRCIHFPYTLKC